MHPGYYLRVVVSDDDPQLVRAADAVVGKDPVAPALSTGVGLVAVGAPVVLATRRRQRRRR